MQPSSKLWVIRGLIFVAACFIFMGWASQQNQQPAEVASRPAHVKPVPVAAKQTCVIEHKNGGITVRFKE